MVTLRDVVPEDEEKWSLESGMLTFDLKGSLKKLVSAAILLSMAIAAPALAVSRGDVMEGVGEVRVQSPAGDQAFRTIFNSWKRLDAIGQDVVAIPSAKPVADYVFTSGFGVRSDPFRHSAAMHAGMDLAGPLGTPIFATADGVISFAGWMRGYGNLVEISHGKAIETRYGHLSRILVQPNSRVKRGQLIALMGSTGRSTGSHLHYEIRVDGRAVNPVPFIQASDYVLAMQNRADSPVALGGPEN